MNIKELIAFLFGMVVATLVTSSIAHHPPKTYLVTWTNSEGQVMFQKIVRGDEGSNTTTGPMGKITVKVSE